jgi:protein TonB
MFETADLHGRVRTIRYGLTLLVSVFVHIMTLVLLIVLPLLFFDVLPDAVLTFVLASPENPPARTAPPPPPPGDRLDKPGEKMPVIRIDELYEPSTIPRGIPKAPDEPVVLGLWGVSGVPGSPIGPGPANEVSALRPELPAPLPPPPAPIARIPITIGGVVLEARLMRKVEPEYPQLARMARVSGTVILQVTVSEEGDVTDVRVLRGHPLLNDASVNAVRQWKYSPTLLNGEPVPVSATVTVFFNLR